jgi:hypothetical protein
METKKPRRHLLIPDTQVRPGVDTNHIDWAAKVIVDYKPDVIIHLGDHWDMPSLNTHARAAEMEGQRIPEDIIVGNDAFQRLVDPMEREISRLRRRRRKLWIPECHFLMGNHEDRITRAIKDNPKLEGVLSTDLLDTAFFDRHPYLEIVEIDGIAYSHYFANTHSGKPIGGSIDNRLNKIGRSFVQGHEQGFLYGVRQFPGSITRHGLVAGSFYLHDEGYRGYQSNGEWRGLVILNEVHDGKYDIMPLSMEYLRRKYA